MISAKTSTLSCSSVTVLPIAGLTIPNPMILFDCFFLPVAAEDAGTAAAALSILCQRQAPLVKLPSACLDGTGLLTLVGKIAQGSPKARAVAVGGADGVATIPAPRAALGADADLVADSAEDVAGTTSPDVAHGGSLLADFVPLVLLVKVKGRTLRVGVGVAGATTARVETAGSAGLCWWCDLGRNAGRRSGLGSLEEVTGTAAASLGVGILHHRGVGLGDGV